MQAKHECEKESIEQIRELENARYDFKVLEEELNVGTRSTKLAEQKIAELQHSLDEIKDRYQTHVHESRGQSVRSREVMECLKNTESSFEGKTRKQI
jgi:hypothetical protein